MIRKLLLLNGIAILFAVYHHSIYWAITAINFWGHRFVSNATPQSLFSPNLFSIFLRITDQIAGVAVPAFLFVSGFLYGFSLNHQSIRQSYRFLQKRIIYLLIPYIIWSSITVVFRLMEGDSYSLTKLARVFLLGEADGPFYYVPLIIQLILLSPFLFRAVKEFPLVAVGIGFLLQFLSGITWYFKILNVSLPQSLNFLNLFKGGYLLSHLLWFIAGLSLFIYREKITSFLKNHRWWILFLIAFFVIFGQIEFQLLINASGNDWINSQSSLITKWLYSLLLLAYVIMGKNIFLSSNIEVLGANSYGIYLSHVIVIEICARLIYHVLPFLLGQTVILLGILVFMGITIPLLMMHLSRKFPIKPIYSYLWG
ncbi:fucose 4-O-acetylase [Bellilinea caldifistulae]|uniref:Acyltransferase 3 domain-containing protein n=1 Tax=Bellilinea caldifistulae TaxID=360411 RepID=A0A0P6XXA7_9CHLR|nr:acyltransferase [Bellilinea caldifistulae]KPL78027.1 hypothetical protein AC812_02080 [Bellilinea caldifistulae]GAP10780.1 fucose 4-O-acetylase [Bellilinea caldifistulae]